MVFCRNPPCSVLSDRKVRIPHANQMFPCYQPWQQRSTSLLLATSTLPPQVHSCHSSRLGYLGEGAQCPTAAHQPPSGPRP